MKFLLLAFAAAAVVTGQNTVVSTPFDEDSLLSPTQVYATITASNRNEVNIAGSTNQVQPRINDQNFYETLPDEPRGGLMSTLPSARLISNTIHSAANGNPESARSISDWHTFWGQFIDHDFILTMEQDVPFDIPVPMGDPVFTNLQVLPFSLSANNIINGVAEQRNALTSFIDAGTTYGETNARAQALRTGTGGLLLSTENSGEVLVRNGNPPLVTMSSAGLVPDEDLYAGGEVRVNENIALAAVHTLWVREHNRYARMIDSSGICENAADVDECIYQEARRRVVAENQAITIGEYSRILFGDQYDTFIGSYTAFNGTINPGCSNEFGILFRYGHTELNEQIMRFSGRPGAYVDQGAVNLNAVFFNPAMLQTGEDVDYILLGNALQRQREIDNVISDAVRNTLFISDPNDSNTGGDLISRNIQRSRSHGQGTFFDLRQQIIDAGLRGSELLSPVPSFDFLPTEVQPAFMSAYNNDPAIIDSWPAAVSETHVDDTTGLGATLLVVISDQYRRIRDGDIFWYENPASPNPFSTEEISELNSLRLSDVILFNSDPTVIEAMPCNAMEDGSGASAPGGVCENPNAAASVVASFGLVASLLFALF